MMTLTLTTPLVFLNDGTIRVANSRVSLDSIVAEFKKGSTAEQIQEDFSSLSLREIYSALAFYLEQTEFVEDYLKKQRSETVESISFIESQLPNGELRANIRARYRETQKL
jgi:uncharacterized protein (DUF433 family)